MLSAQKFLQAIVIFLILVYLAPADGSAVFIEGEYNLDIKQDFVFKYSEVRGNEEQALDRLLIDVPGFSFERNLQVKAVAKINDLLEFNLEYEDTEEPYLKDLQFSFFSEGITVRAGMFKNPYLPGFLHNRTLKGVQLEKNWKGLDLSLGYNLREGEKRIVNIRGNGTKGPYNLQYYPIVEGSERVFVDGRQLVADEDYFIDYRNGQITFTKFLPHFIEIKVEFDYLPEGEKTLQHIIYSRARKGLTGFLLIRGSNKYLDQTYLDFVSGYTGERSGLSFNLKGSLQDPAEKPDNGGLKAVLTAYRNLGKLNLSSSFEYISKDFKPLLEDASPGLEINFNSEYLQRTVVIENQLGYKKTADGTESLVFYGKLKKDYLLKKDSRLMLNLGAEFKDFLQEDRKEDEKEEGLEWLFVGAYQNPAIWVRNGIKFKKPEDWEYTGQINLQLNSKLDLMLWYRRLQKESAGGNSVFHNLQGRLGFSLGRAAIAWDQDYYLMLREGLLQQKNMESTIKLLTDRVNLELSSEVLEGDPAERSWSCALGYRLRENTELKLSGNREKNKEGENTLIELNWVQQWNPKNATCLSLGRQRGSESQYYYQVEWETDLREWFDLETRFKWTEKEELREQESGILLKTEIKNINLSTEFIYIMGQFTDPEAQGFSGYSLKITAVLLF